MAYTYNAQGNTTNMGDWNPSVAQLQQQLNSMGANLVVDGKYGPLTQQAYQQFMGSGNKPPAGSTTQTPPAPAQPSGNQFDPEQIKAFLGLSDSTWNSLSPSQQTALIGAGGVMYGKYDSGQNINPAFTTQDFEMFLNEAQNDPNIQQYYGDQLKVAQSDMAQQLGYLNTLYGIEQANQEIKFRRQNQQLDESVAQGGQAYSGFRGRAEKDLQTEQQGIIESSRAKRKQDLYNMGSKLEQRFGTQGLGQFGNLNYGDQTYAPIGGLFGTFEQDKKYDIQRRAQDIAGQSYYSRFGTQPQ